MKQKHGTDIYDYKKFSILFHAFCFLIFGGYNHQRSNRIVILFVNKETRNIFSYRNLWEDISKNIIIDSEVSKWRTRCFAFSVRKQQDA